MKLALPEQMGAIDQYAIRQMGIPGIVLMENAALKVVEEAEKMLGGLKDRDVLLLAGKGNNGGDAFAAARHLYHRGSCVVLYIMADIVGISGDAATNLQIAGNMGIRIIELAGTGNYSDLLADIGKAELIIDGIFGTGFKGEVAGVPGDVIRMVNRSGKKVLAIDIPSGVQGKTGKTAQLCIKADRTVTFCLPKLGLVVHPGCEYTGELVVADIGIPRQAVESQDIKFETIDRNMVSSIMPGRWENSNKGDYGKVMLVSGSTGMTGSGRLCAMSALRAGAGLVYLGVPASLSPIYSAALVEPIVVPLEDGGNGRLSPACASEILEQMAKMDAAAVGPGLSTGEGVPEVVYDVVENAEIPLVLDADALNAIARNKQVLRKLKKQAVITPHPGEMARLTGKSIGEIQIDRINTAAGFAAEWGTVVVLKGSRTVVALPDGRTYINISGNPGMATGGTGDVLAGIIAGLSAQGMAPAGAAAAGVYLHAAAGDAAAARKGMHGMTAGDLLEELPYVIKNLTP
jgi:NAD(P)H-hydrate epimerase